MNLNECKEIVRKTAMSLPPSDFGSGRAIDLMATVMLELVDDVLAEASVTKVDEYERIIAGLNKQLTEQFELTSRLAAKLLNTPTPAQGD